MTLPLLPARADKRSGWRRPIAAAVLVVLALAAASRPGRTQDQDPYSATVAVDATADSVVKAREKARLDGQRRALDMVVARLSGGAAPARLAKLDDRAITDLVTSFAVANERMSAVRYVADYTFHFQPDAVRRLLGDAGIAVEAGSGRPVVVVPLYEAGGQATLWEDPNPWREAWDRQQPPAGGPVRLVVPLGDAGDIAAIDAARARAGDSAALTAIAGRNGGGEDAVVALAAVRGPPDHPVGLDVTVRRYHEGQLLDSHLEPLTANPGEPADALWRRAVAAIVSDIESGWNRQQVADVGPEGSLTAVLPIASLGDWVAARRRLAAVPAIRKLTLVALSRTQATIEINYLGSIDQLKTGLAQANLDLVPGDPLWRLARTGAATPPAP